MTISTYTQKVFQLILVIAVLTLLACTSVPTREFTSYRQAFADARAAGEQVLFDYSSAVKAYELEKKLLAEKSSESTTPSAIANDRTANFDPITSDADVAKPDDVTLRIRAWDTVQRYNDVLLSLAEGKSTAQISAAVDGLMQSLATFPLEDIAAAVSTVNPYVGVLKEVLTLAEFERSRRKFVAAVKKGAPIIGAPIQESAASEEKETFQSFLKLLRDDAKNFYNIRKGLNDLAYDRIVDEAAGLGRQYRILLLEYKSNNDLEKLTTEVNKQLQSISLSSIELTEEEKEQATNAYTPVIHNQLLQIRDQIGAKVNAARQKTGELTAYKTMSVAYVKLINQVSESLLALLTAVESDLKTTPPIRELLPVYIELRQAIYFYRDSRGG
ncbi:MAG: hypothetical protein JSW26_27820 [Desulfobacterales bacterium]|nr:MAG: hypothetical protein JSW26_27820 [Desulfobacterales bacterium]